MNRRHCTVVALGSALGAVLRQGTGDLYAVLGIVTFPWDTLTVNALGSLLIGWLAALTMPHGRLPLSIEWRLFLMGGICGGFTTFSVFSLETLALLRRDEWLLAGANMLATAVLCLALVWAGYALAMHMARRGVASR